MKLTFQSEEKEAVKALNFSWNESENEYWHYGSNGDYDIISKTDRGFRLYSYCQEEELETSEYFQTLSELQAFFE